MDVLVSYSKKALLNKLLLETCPELSITTEKIKTELSCNDLQEDTISVYRTKLDVDKHT